MLRLLLAIVLVAYCLTATTAVYAVDNGYLKDTHGNVYQFELSPDDNPLKGNAKKPEGVEVDVLSKPIGYIRYLGYALLLVAASILLWAVIRITLNRSNIGRRLARMLPKAKPAFIASTLLLIASILLSLNAVYNLWIEPVSDTKGVLELVGENAGLKNLQDYYLGPISVLLGFLAILFVINIESNRLGHERKHNQLRAQENLRDAAEYATELLKEFDRHQLDFIHDPIPLEFNQKNTDAIAQLAKRLESGDGKLVEILSYYPEYLVIDDNQEADKDKKSEAYFSQYLLLLFYFSQKEALTLVKNEVFRSIASQFSVHLRQLLDSEHQDLSNEFLKVQQVIEDLFLRADFTLDNDANRATMQHFLNMQRLSQEINEIRKARVFLKNFSSVTSRPENKVLDNVHFNKGEIQVNKGEIQVNKGEGSTPEKILNLNPNFQGNNKGENIASLKPNLQVKVKGEGEGEDEVITRDTTEELIKQLSNSSVDEKDKFQAAKALFARLDGHESNEILKGIVPYEYYWPTSDSELNKLKTAIHRLFSDNISENLAELSSYRDCWPTSENEFNKLKQAIHRLLNNMDQNIDLLVQYQALLSDDQIDKLARAILKKYEKCAKNE